MPPLDSDMVLRTEANAIRGADIHRPPATDADTIREGVTGKELYRALHTRNSAALCLSGGGIRSASFGLGVIEALAVHPRQESAEKEGERQAASPNASLLSQFHYLSTVSGGGYVGSWLSAWIARAGYPEVWRKLKGLREHPDAEPGEIAWLRAYSNYLTPTLGLFSADTWTAIALYVRNLLLNWLVLLPAVCLLLLAVKLATVIAFWISTKQQYLVVLATVATLLMVWTLRFAMRNRPTCSARTPAHQPQAGESTDHHRNEAGRVAAGAGWAKFFWLCLIPALVAANALSIYMAAKHHTVIETWKLWQTVVVCLVGGFILYAISWITAVPFKTCGEQRGVVYWTRDWLCWSSSGGVYGALVGLGAHLFVHQDLSILIGYADVPTQTSKLLILVIYGVPWIVHSQLTAEMIFVGLTSWQRGSDSDREWFGRSTGWFAAAGIVWFIVAFLILVGAELGWQYVTGNYSKYASAILGALSGVISAWFGASGKSGATDQSAKKSSWTTTIALRVAPPLFLVMLVVAISLLLDYVLFENALIESPLLGAGDAAEFQRDWIWLWMGIGTMLFVALLSWTRVNINRFSIHALYRNRLIRAYLGASNPERTPNPFTGFDEGDNYRMEKLWPPRKGCWQPFHVVNIALNVVASSRLAWQERKAEPFTATPLHCGTATFSGATDHSLGYRPTCDYASKTGGLTLGTALAISGAAASPNMGYHSSPMVSLLLALFNVRLGWWLGNPGAPGEDSYQKEGPGVAILPYAFEMFGQTTDTWKYVYLSDGGHFENLGLYEMIRRRCRCIVVSDAGCDPAYGFEDLGNAVRKIAIDLGVYISFGKLHELKARSKDNAVIEGAYYAIGEIDYKTAPEWIDAPADVRQKVDNGYILYIKPGYHGTESAGVVAYATANAAFPHETTGDQFFSESQFESYRTLGFEIMDGALRAAAQNLQMIARSGVLPTEPSRDKLCDLINALRADVVKQADDVMRSEAKQLAPG